MGQVVLSDFSGGLNTRDSPNELAPNETPNASNFTLDTRGALRWRNGCSAGVTLPGVASANDPAHIFYSGALGLWLCVRRSAGTTYTLYTRPADLSGSWTSRGTVITATAAADLVVSFADWSGTTNYVVIALSVGANSSASYTDGATVTAIGTVTGNAVAVWQNRVWIAGAKTSTLQTRLYASKIGDPTTWAAPDGITVDLRDKDGERLTGLGLAGGALIVFKQRSAYRVSDSATGSYATIDSSAGSQGPLAVVPSRGRLYTWGHDGLYEWDGVGPGRNVGDKARPSFVTAAALVGGVPLLCGGQLEDRLLFAFPISLSGTNDKLLEFDPIHGWLMRHALMFTGSSVCSFARKDTTLYAAAPDVNGNVIFPVFDTTPGSDNGTGPTAGNLYRTPWIHPAKGRLARIVRAQIEGLLVTAGTNTLTLNVYTDWDFSAATLSFDISADLRGGDSSDQVETSVLWSLGHSRSFCFEFVASTATGAAQINSLAFDAVQIEA